MLRNGLSTQLATRRFNDYLAKDQDQHDESVEERRAQLLRILFEPFAQGAGPAAYEAKLLSQDWGIEFGDITYNNLYIWYAEKDWNSPLPMTEYYVKLLSNNPFLKCSKAIHTSRFIGIWTRFSQSWFPRAHSITARAQMATASGRVCGTIIICCNYSIPCTFTPLNHLSIYHILLLDLWGIVIRNTLHTVSVAMAEWHVILAIKQRCRFTIIRPCRRQFLGCVTAVRRWYKLRSRFHKDTRTMK